MTHEARSKTHSEMLKDTFKPTITGRSGGRPAYSLFQMYRCMILKLGLHIIYCQTACQTWTAWTVRELFCWQLTLGTWSWEIHTDSLQPWPQHCNWQLVTKRWAPSSRQHMHVIIILISWVASSHTFQFVWTLWHIVEAICLNANKTANTDTEQRGPSGATFSRVRGKLDILAMYCRRWLWKHHGFQPFWVSLCLDLSLCIWIMSILCHTSNVPPLYVDSVQAMMQLLKAKNYSSSKNTRQGPDFALLCQFVCS